MKFKSIITSALVFACASAFAYRDAIADLTCNSIDGCGQNVTVPCGPGSGGTTNCVAVQLNGGNVPGGTQKCMNGDSPTYYASTASPNGWTDCQSKDGVLTSCPRYSKTCMVVYFYEAQTDCNNQDNLCGRNIIPACTNGTAPVGGNPGSPGPPCNPT